MAGHMGAVRRTIQNLEIARIEIEDGLILIKGATPGAKGTWLEVRDAVEKAATGRSYLPGCDNDRS